MRIAFILGRFPVLAETFVLDQITGLIDRGHEVEIYAQEKGDTSQVHSEVTEYGLLDKARWAMPIPKNWFARFAKAFWFCIEQGWKKPLCILRCLDFFKYGKSAFSLRTLYIAMPYFDTNPYDVIVCHFGPNGLLAVKLQELGLIEGKIVTIFHAYDIYEYPKQKGLRIYEQLFAKGDLFLAVSKSGRDELLRLGCPAERLMIHRVGVDTDKLTCVQPSVCSNGKISIVSIARLVEKKGIEYGVQAVAKLKKKFPQVKYTVVGDGPLRQTIEDLIEKLGLDDTVELTGWKKREEVEELLDSACVLVAPSVTADSDDKEGIPVAIMEAMARQVPVVATRHGAIAELVEDGVSGFLVEERDIEGLTDKLSHLLENRQTWPEMGKAARERIVAEYEINKLNDRLADMFCRLCQNGSLS